MANGMLLSWNWLSDIGDFLSGVFSIIPKLLYFIISCVLSLIDLCQVAFRKLAGLDPIMISDEVYTGDTVYKLITDALFTGRYPAVRTVFWALIILGIFMLFITSIIAVIRLEYAPDKDKGNSKGKVVSNFFKAIFSFAVVPIACLFGMFLANSLVSVIDTATAYTASTQTEIATYYDKWETASLDLNDPTINASDNEKLMSNRSSYYAYNVFGLRIPTTSEPFSASIFRACAYGCNRIRNSDSYFATLKEAETLGILQNFDDNDEAANIIDTGFAINAKLKGTYNLNTSLTSGYFSDWSGWISFDGWNYSGLTELSKYNVNAVYYFYNLWSFNYIVGFVAVISIGKSFYNFVLFLMQRLFEILGLFLISPISISLMPLDGGDSLKTWRSTFVTKFALLVIMILSLNLITPLMSICQNIKMFGVPIIDYIITTFFLIACLNAVSSLNSMLTKIFTGDAKNFDQVNNAASQIQSNFGAGLKTTASAARLAATPVTLPAKLAGKGIKWGVGKWNDARDKAVTNKTNANIDAQIQAEEDRFNNDSQVQTLNSQKLANQEALDALNSDSQMFADYNALRGKNAKHMDTAAGQADMEAYLKTRGYSDADAQAAAQRLADRSKAIKAGGFSGNTTQLQTAMNQSFTDERNNLTKTQANIDAQLQQRRLAMGIDANKQKFETERQKRIDEALQNRFSRKAPRVVGKVVKPVADVTKPLFKPLTNVLNTLPFTQLFGESVNNATSGWGGGKPKP